jgi:hypothetical protein
VQTSDPSCRRSWGGLRKSNEKTMKKLLLVAIMPMLLVWQLSSCSGGSEKESETDKVENIGKVSVENGAGKKDTVDYVCVGCEELLPSKKEFDMLINEATERTKETLKYPLSFIPKKITLTLFQEDTLYAFDSNEKMKDIIKVIVTYAYIGKNTYGNELEGDHIDWFYLQDLKITDIEENIRLEPLRLKNGSVNRTLEIMNHNGEESLQIIPGKNGSIIAVSSLGCVDEGTWLLLNLENGEEIKLVSWNDFNCDGTSYFRAFSADQKEKLKSSRLESITVVDDKSIICPVPKNESDYFQQLVAL